MDCCGSGGRLVSFLCAFYFFLCLASSVRVPCPGASRVCPLFLIVSVKCVRTCPSMPYACVSSRSSAYNTYR